MTGSCLLHTCRASVQMSKLLLQTLPTTTTTTPPLLALTISWSDHSFNADKHFRSCLRVWRNVNPFPFNTFTLGSALVRAPDLWICCSES